MYCLVVSAVIVMNCTVIIEREQGLLFTSPHF